MGDEDKEERQESRASVWHSKTKDFQESPIKSLKEKLLLEEEPTTSHGQVRVSDAVIKDDLFTD